MRGNRVFGMVILLGKVGWNHLHLEIYRQVVASFPIHQTLHRRIEVQEVALCHMIVIAVLDQTAIALGNLIFLN